MIQPKDSFRQECEHCLVLVKSNEKYCQECLHLINEEDEDPTDDVDELYSD